MQPFLPPGRPCQGCGGDAWQGVRPGLVDGTWQWLRSGGHWRPYTAVCGGCGARSGVGCLFGRDGPRSALPVRLSRALWRTVQQERDAEPVPWLYLAAGAGGALVGAGAAQVIRSGRPVLGTVTGCGAGLTTCWAVFASTALRHSTTWHELRLAALQELDPARAERERAQEQERLWHSVAFPVWGLPGWPGPRSVAGSWSTDRSGAAMAQTVALGHGDPREAPYVQVETAPDGEHVEDEQHLAEDLAGAAWADDHPPGEDPAAWFAGMDRARAAADVAWQERRLLVDGTPVPVRWAAAGERWAAHLPVEGAQLVVRAVGVPPDDVRLARVDVRDYPALSDPSHG